MWECLWARAPQAVKKRDRNLTMWPNWGFQFKTSQTLEEKEADWAAIYREKIWGSALSPSSVYLLCFISVPRATRSEANVQSKQVSGQLSPGYTAAPGMLCSGGPALNGNIEKLSDGRPTGAEMGEEESGHRVL